MKDSIKIALGIMLGCGGIVVTLACCFLVVTVVFGVTIFPIEGFETITHSALGEGTIFDKFEITVDAFEFSDGYVTKYQSTKDPPVGAKFAWMHITVQNIGNTAELAPGSVDFKLVYLNDEIHGVRGDREGYPDYTGGVLFGDEVYPGTVHEGWLRFTVPAA